MKHECDIIRDLMPMCMDDTASQASRKAVTEHAAECAECHRIFEEMKNTIPEETCPEDFRQEIQLIRRARYKRGWRRCVAWVLTIMVVFFGAFELKDKLQNEWDRPLDASEYDLSIVRRTNGDVLFVIKQSVPYLLGYSSQFDVAAGAMIYTPNVALWPKQIDESRMHEIDRYDPFIWVEGEGLYIEHMKWDENVPREDSTMHRVRNPVHEIWSGGELIYRRGDEIPLASPELEQYMINFDELTQSRDEYWAVWEEEAAVRNQEHANYQRTLSIADEQLLLKQTMPELQ